MARERKEQALDAFLVASARAYLNAINRLMIERGAAAQGALEGTSQSATG